MVEIHPQSETFNWLCEVGGGMDQSTQWSIAGSSLLLKPLHQKGGRVGVGSLCVFLCIPYDMFADCDLSLLCPTTTNNNKTLLIFNNY